MTRQLLAVACPAHDLVRQLELSIAELRRRRVHDELDLCLPSSNEPLRIALTPKAERELGASRG